MSPSSNANKSTSVLIKVFANLIIFLVIILLVPTVPKIANFLVNYDYMKMPMTGDAYLVNCRRFNLTKFSNNLFSPLHNGSYTVFFVVKMDDNRIVLVGDSNQFGPLKYGIKQLKKYIDSNLVDFKPINNISVSKQNIKNLIYSRTIVHIDRDLKMEVALEILFNDLSTNDHQLQQ